MSHWSGQARQWDQVEAPLRPTPAVVQQLCGPLADAGDPALVLGVTPELTAALPRVLAVDRSATMIERLWPGDQPGRRALCADWLDLEPSGERYSGAVGDGSLTVLGTPQRVEQLLDRLLALLPAGAPLRLRVFLRPEAPWSLEQLQAVSQSPGDLNFYAFKWMLAMHLAGKHQDHVPVTSILNVLNQHWPDRALLAKRTGWTAASIDTIEVYRESADLYWFPTATTLLELLNNRFRNVQLSSCGSYPLATQCPILSARR